MLSRTFHAHAGPLALAVVLWLGAGVPAAAQSVSAIPIGGFTPLVGFGLTPEFDDLDDGDTFFNFADVSMSPGAPFLGAGGTPFFDVALYDTGAQLNLIRQEEFIEFGLGEAPERDPLGFLGTADPVVVQGVAGTIAIRPDDPLGIYAAGLQDATGGAALAVNTANMVGQTSVSLGTVLGPTGLPNVVGLPFASTFTTVIRNSAPQILNVNGTTYRSPQLELLEASATVAQNQGILRRVGMTLEPAASLGPFYQFNFDNAVFDPPLFYENPTTPTLLPSGFFIEPDLEHDGNVRQERRFFFDTGAQVTVLSETAAAQLGIDPILDTPDFFINEIVGGGGVLEGVPGFILDQLSLPTVGGSFVVHNVPVVILDTQDPLGQGTIDGILGMNVFADRDIVIDPAGSKLYISDPVTTRHDWDAAAGSAAWETTSSWSSPGTPGVLWAVNLANTIAGDQTAVVSTASQVFRGHVGGTGGHTMTLSLAAGGDLTLFADLEVAAGGVLHLDGGTLRPQSLRLIGGTLTGSGDIEGFVENTSRIAPGSSLGTIAITGALVQRDSGTIAMELDSLGSDVIGVDGSASLRGTLELSWIDAGGPTLGLSYDVLTADIVVGTFDHVTGVVLDSLAGLAVTYDADRVTVTVAILGDANRDGTVSLADLSLLGTNWNQDGTWAQGDFNGDGMVSLADLSLLGSNWNTGPLSVEELDELAVAFTLVPEPGSAAVLLLGWAVLAGYRPRPRGAQTRQALQTARPMRD